MHLTQKLRTCGLALILLVSHFAFAQDPCIQIELAVYNSCVAVPNPIGLNGTVEAEILIIEIGDQAIPFDEISIDLPFNGFGAQNADVGAGEGCPFGTPNVRELLGCPNVIFTQPGAGRVLEANAILLFITTGTADTEDFAAIDFSEICATDRTVYLAQNGCERSVSALANSLGSGRNFRAISISAGCGGATFIYDLTQTTDADGSYTSGCFYGTREDCSVPAPDCDCDPGNTTVIFCDDGPRPSATSAEIFKPNTNVPVSDVFYTSTEDASLENNPLTVLPFNNTQVDTFFYRTELLFCDRIDTLFLTAEDRTAVTMNCQTLASGNTDLTEGQVTINVNGPFPFYILSYEGPEFGSLFIQQLNRTNTISDLPAGDYVGRLTSFLNCGELDNCTFTITNTPIICNDDTLRLEVLATAPTDTLFVPASGVTLNQLNQADTTILLDVTGCDSTIITTLHFPPPVRSRIYLPTAFSPNGDGVNDTYEVGLPDANASISQIRFYDRYGGLVYSGTAAWDGQIDGQAAASGTYVVVVFYVVGSQTLRRQGFVNLVR